MFLIWNEVSPRKKLYSIYYIYFHKDPDLHWAMLNKYKIWFCWCYFLIYKLQFNWTQIHNFPPRNSAFTLYHNISSYHPFYMVIHSSFHLSSNLHPNWFSLVQPLENFLCREKEIFQALWAIGSLSQVHYSTWDKSSQNNT